MVYVVFQTKMFEKSKGRVPWAKCRGPGQKVEAEGKRHVSKNSQIIRYEYNYVFSNGG